MKKKNNALLTGPYLIWTVAFIVIPLILIVYYGFTDENHRFTLDNLSRITDPVTLKALLLSLLLSALATAICLVMAYPLAMILSRMKSGASAIITTIFIIPMWMNSLLRIFAWQTLLERNGVINQLLSFLHLPVDIDQKVKVLPVRPIRSISLSAMTFVFSGGICSCITDSAAYVTGAFRE